MNKITDSEIMRALMAQVRKAAQGRVETEVTTYITLPMWRAFCRAVGLPKNSTPTEWLGIKNTRRVFGSETIISHGNTMRSVSFCFHVEPQRKPHRGGY